MYQCTLGRNEFLRTVFCRFRMEKKAKSCFKLHRELAAFGMKMKSETLLSVWTAGSPNTEE